MIFYSIVIPEANVAVLVSVLAILCDGIQTVELHDAETAAWSALIRFVDARWSHRLPGVTVPCSEAERVERFFADGTSEWLVAEADVSELNDAVNAANPHAIMPQSRAGP